MLSAKNNQLPIIVICSGLIFFLLFIVLILFSVLKLIKSKRYESDLSQGHHLGACSNKLDNAHVNLLIKTTGLNDSSKHDSSLETHSNVSSNSTNTTTNTANELGTGQAKFNKIAKYLCAQNNPNEVVSQYCSPSNLCEQVDVMGMRRGGQCDKFLDEIDASDYTGLNNHQQNNSDSNNKNEYLIDSPILVRKMFECNVDMTGTSSSNVNTKQTAHAGNGGTLKKYNLEYLFENGTSSKVGSSPISANSSNLVVPASFTNQPPKPTSLANPNNNTKPKPKKKIKFNFNNESSQSPLHTNTSNDETSDDKFVDDDCILPVRMNPRMYTNNSKGYHQSGGMDTLPSSTFRFTNDLNRCIPHPPHLIEQHQQQHQIHTAFHSNTLNGKSSLTYKKSSMQPEDNIWIKKYPSGENSNGGMNVQHHHNHQNQYRYHHHHHQQQQQQSVVNADYSSSRTAVLYGPNDKEVVL
jgi:hypothetical protein